MAGRRFDVFLDETLVGQLSESRDDRFTFQFVESYRRLPLRPVLSQSFEDDLHAAYRGKPGRLPAFFANLVPEGPLRELIEESAGIEPEDDLALLSVVGADLPGAVVLRPGPMTVRYDQVCTVAWSGSERPPEQRLDRKLALKLGGVKPFGDVYAATFHKLATHAGADGEQTVALVRQTVSRLFEVWPLIERDAPMRKDQVEALHAHWERVPILRESG